MIPKEYYTKKGPHEVTIKAPVQVGICKIKGGFLITINGEPISPSISGNSSTDAYSKAVKAQCLIGNTLHELGIQHTTQGLTKKETRKGASEYYPIGK